MVPEQWQCTELDVSNPKQLAQAFAKVAETRRVALHEARALGFLHESGSEVLNEAGGLVEVPKWRHALINIAHPLLKKGLIILDTPGLNAIGAEPELTVSLIPKAHAVVFILAADAGVTQSDLSIWREHLMDDPRDAAARLVVLNKIDTLWDALDSPAEVQTQIDRQMRESAQTLGITPEQVVAVSAQKGLLAKLRKDSDLLKRSGLVAFEDALAQGIVGRRQQILGALVARGIESLRGEMSQVVQVRRRDLTEQFVELKALQGKNRPVIRNMRARIAQEQADFDAAGVKIHAVRSVHLRLMREVFGLLGPSSLKKEMALLTAALNQKGLKLGIKQAYGETFERLRGNVAAVHAKSFEIHHMLEAMFLQINTEYGFSLQVPNEPRVEGCQADLDLIERSHLQYLGLGNALRLARPEFAQQLMRALSTRLRGVYENKLEGLEIWSKSAASQLDTQLRERRKTFVRRLEAVDRIEQASDGLEERLAELGSRSAHLDQAQAKLAELTGALLQMAEPERFGVGMGLQVQALD